MRILLIEPDIFLGKKLKELLEKNRCTVDLILDERELLCCHMFSSFQLIIFGISSTGIFTVPIHTFIARKITSRTSRIKNATPYLILSLPACAVFFCPFGIFISCLSCFML